MKTKFFTFIALASILITSGGALTPALAQAKENNNGQGHAHEYEQQEHASVQTQANIQANIQASNNARIGSEHGNDDAAGNASMQMNYGRIRSAIAHQEHGDDNNNSHYCAYNQLFSSIMPVTPGFQAANRFFGFDDRGDDDSAPCGPAVTSTAPVITQVVASNITATSALITWNTSMMSDSHVLYGTSSPVTASSSLQASSAQNTLSHSIALQNLAPSTTYYFTVSSANRFGNTSTSSQYTFTTTASASLSPVISSIASTNASTSTIDITWTTDQPANSVVWYSTSSPVTASSPTANASSSTLVTNHTMTLAGLTASTTYYGIITSTNASGSITTSGQFSFNTTAIPAPLAITSLMATTTNATTATIGWLTNYPASSNIWYSTTSPVNINSTSTAFVSFPALVTAHMFAIPGLSPSTIYYFIVSSIDALGHTATSSQSSFTTQ